MAGETLRISPDALRWRAAVSNELPHATRIELKDLALRVPIPVSGALNQTKMLLDQQYPDLDLRDRVLIEFYFIVARLEASRQFSREFERREDRIREGLESLDEYQRWLERSIRQTPRREGPEMELPLVQELPLERVGWSETSTGERRLLILHSYPEPNPYWGRDNLVEIRDAVQSDRALLLEEQGRLWGGRKEFLEEVSSLGWELERLEPELRGLVRAPRAGLPFSF